MQRPGPVVFLETTFLYSLLRTEYDRPKDVGLIYKMAMTKRIQLGIPYICFKEAVGALGRDVKEKVPESVTKFYKHFATRHKDWNSQQVKKFLEHNRRYHADYLWNLDREAEKLKRSLKQSLLYPDSRFERILFEELVTVPGVRGLDEIVLAHILSAARRHQGRLRYFCSTDSDFAETDKSGHTRSEWSELYRRHELTFVRSFGEMIDILLREGRVAISKL